MTFFYKYMRPLIDAGFVYAASAVVSDIIAAVRHKQHFQGIGWSERMIEIEPMGSNAFRYLIRIEGMPEGIESDIRELFLDTGAAFQPVLLDGRSDEFGILTDLMFESDFLENHKEFEAKTGRRIFHFMRARRSETEA